MIGVTKLTEAILQLSNNLQNFGLCKHELKEIQYFYINLSRTPVTLVMRGSKKGVG